MTVYVDDMRREFWTGRRRALMSHLMADTPEELTEFANRLGLKPQWRQAVGTHREHFDVTETYRQVAIREGAQAISYPRETGELMSRKRAAAS